MNNSNNIKNKLDEIDLIYWGDNGAYHISTEDFKTYLLPLMIYKEISEKIENHLNKELINDKLTFEEAYEHQEYQTPLKEESLKEVGYYLTPNYLFKNVMIQLAEDYKEGILDLEYALNYLSDCEFFILWNETYELLYDKNYNLKKEFEKLRGLPFKYDISLREKAIKIIKMGSYIEHILKYVSIEEYFNFHPQYKP